MPMTKKLTPTEKEKRKDKRERRADRRSMRLFLDESGNTGSDILDRDQPVFALAGVWLTASSEEHFKQRISSLRSRHNIQGNGEIKGKNLVGSPSGRKAVVELIDELVTARVPMSLLGVEKRYFASGVIVDDCTDHAYNSAFDVTWTHMDRKQPLIDLVQDHADAALLEAAWRSRIGEVAQAKIAYGRLFDQLKQCDETSLYAERMSGVDLDELWSCRAIERQPGRGYSPNLTAFSWMLTGCEKQAELLRFNDVKLIHDDQPVFREAFSHWWQLRTRLSLERLKQLEFCDSRSEIGIQIADVLASALRMVMHDAPESANEGRASELVEPLHRAFWQRETAEPFPWFIGLSRWQRRMMDRLRLEPDAPVSQ
jgi:Protein of unknown function (DUF3800)